jgi:UDPglucose 6-dehydrogenase
MPAARAVLPPSVVYCTSAYDAADGADAIALVTEWNEFRLLDLERLRTRLRRPLVFDGRQCWDPERMRRLGFEYHSLGRTPVMPT